MAEEPCGNSHALECGLANNCPVPEDYYGFNKSSQEIYDEWQADQNTDEEDDEETTDNPCGTPHTLDCGLANSCPVPEDYYGFNKNSQEAYDEWQAAQEAEDAEGEDGSEPEGKHGTESSDSPVDEESAE